MALHVENHTVSWIHQNWRSVGKANESTCKHQSTETKSKRITVDTQYSILIRINRPTIAAHWCHLLMLFIGENAVNTRYERCTGTSVMIMRTCLSLLTRWHHIGWVQGVSKRIPTQRLPEPIWYQQRCQQRCTTMHTYIVESDCLWFLHVLDWLDSPSRYWSCEWDRCRLAGWRIVNTMPWSMPNGNFAIANGSFIVVSTTMHNNENLYIVESDCLRFLHVLDWLDSPSRFSLMLQ